MKNFSYKGNEFFLDGEPFIVRAGAIHYFRIPRAYWRDRLLKLKECGFNTVETYVAWNVHEPREGEFVFDGENDVSEFLSEAQRLGLYAIVRPCPYICAEWESGGLPAWLLKDGNMRLRCNYPPYMQKVEKYLHRLSDVLRPHLLSAGGNVIMMQVENEYGSFGNDKTYLQRLADIFRECGMDCLLFTADGVWYNMVSSGSLPEKCLPFLTFGSRTQDAMKAIGVVASDTPKMCAEFWCGWFDHWGEEHHVRHAEDVIKDFEPFLTNRWSFNLYMFCGGTNFGFMNGANFKDGKLLPTVTSYDYCAPLNEAGDRTETYYALRDIMRSYGVDVPALTAKDSEKAAYGYVGLNKRMYLSENVDKFAEAVTSACPLFMEEIGQNYGYILYSTTIPYNLENAKLYIDGLADRALVYLDGEKTAVFERGKEIPDVTINTLYGAKKLDILVENRGRINYGQEIYDRKGLSRVRLGFVSLFGWKIFPLFESGIPIAVDEFGECVREQTNKPVICAAFFDVDKANDTFVKLSGVGRGFIEINGKNLGRFDYDEGPQKTLYVPAPFLKEGRNEIVVFSSDGAEENVIATFVNSPEL